MKKSIAIVGLLACSPLWAAEGLSYNHVDLSWIADTELDGAGSVDGDGFDLGGVFSINETFYVLGNYEDVTYDGSVSDLDVTSISVGVGAHSNAFTGGVDIFGNLTYENLEFDFGPGIGSADDNGFGLEVGARMPLGTNADAFVSYEYNDIDDFEVNFFKLGGQYALTPNWGITAEYRTGEYDDANLDRDDLRLGARYNF